MDWKSTETCLSMPIIIKGNHRSMCTFYHSILILLYISELFSIERDIEIKE